nr:hypothetical protein [Escherichia coli]
MLSDELQKNQNRLMTLHATARPLTRARPTIPGEDGVIILSEEDNTSMALHSVTELMPVVYESLSKLLPSLDELCPVTA